MRKTLLVISFISSSILLAGCVGPVSSISALQVNSTPKTTVFLDGKHEGQTPYYNEKLKTGEHTLKLVPESSAGGATSPSWEVKIKLSPDVLTVVNRDIKESEAASSGEILNLEAIPSKDTGEITILTDPDGANVKLDGQEKGIAPLLIKNISAEDHEITLSAVGATDKIVRVRSTNGYKVIINAKLESNTGVQKITGTLPTISPVTSVAPTGKVGIPGKNSVKILETPTGWLRVRVGPSLGATEAAKVNTGDVFPYLGEDEGWLKIEYQEGKEGWVSSQYAQKINPTP